MTSATGELSLALSAEQLAVLGGLLGEPLPGHVTSVLDGLTRARREAALAAAHRSLTERGILIPGQTPDAPARIPITAIRLLQIACRPELTVALHHADGPQWSPHVTRIAAVPEAAVETVPNGDTYRFTPLHTEYLLARVAVRCALAQMPPPAAAAATLPLGLLRAAATAGTTSAAIGLLRDGGVPDDTAESAGTALASGRRHAVSIVLRATPRTRTGGEVAWAAGPDGYWLLPPALTPVGGDTSGEPHTADTDGITVRLAPASGEAVLTALTTALPTHS